MCYIRSMKTYEFTFTYRDGADFRCRIVYNGIIQTAFILGGNGYELPLYQFKDDLQLCAYRHFAELLVHGLKEI